MPLPWEVDPFLDAALAGARVASKPSWLGGGPLPPIGTLPPLPGQEEPPAPQAGVRLEPEASPDFMQGQAPPDEKGLLERIGYWLDTDSAYTRGLLAGRPGERASGQDIFEGWGLKSTAEDEPISSPWGIAGLTAEMVFDLKNLFLGFGALTKAGKAAKVFETGLEGTRALSAELRATQKAAQAAEALGDIERATALATEAGQLQGKLRATGQAIKTGADPLAGALGTLREAGTPYTLAKDWGEAAAQGQRRLFGLGGAFEPIPFTPAWFTLPEKTLIQGAPVLKGLQATGQVLGGLPPIKQIGQLFSKAPPGLEAQQAEILGRELERAKAAAYEGTEKAADEAVALRGALGRIDPNDLPPDLPQGPPPGPGLGPITPPPGGAGPGGASPFFDPATGEAIDPLLVHAFQGQPLPTQLDPAFKGTIFEGVPPVEPRAPIEEFPPLSPVPEPQGPLLNQVPELPPVAEQAPFNPATLDRPVIDPALEDVLKADVAPLPDPYAAKPGPRLSKTVAPLDLSKAEGAAAQLPKKGDQINYVPKGFKKPQPTEVLDVLPDGRLLIQYGRAQKVPGSKFPKIVPVTETIEASESLLQGGTKAARARADELAQFGTGERRAIRDASRDANVALDALNERQLAEVEAMANDPLKAAKERSYEANRLRMEQIGEYTPPDAIGTGPLQKVKALPAILEDLLPQVERGEIPMPGLKSIETVPSPGQGAKFQLAGHPYEIIEELPGGKVRAKDGPGMPEAVFPEGLVPHDRGTKVQAGRVATAAPLPDADILDPAGAEALKRRAKNLRQMASLGDPEAAKRLEEIEAGAAAQVPFTVTKQTRQQLYDLGLSRAEVDAMTPAEALARLKQAEAPKAPRKLSMSDSQAVRVQEGLQEFDAAQAIPEQAEHVQALKAEVRQPPPIPKPAALPKVPGAGVAAGFERPAYNGAQWYKDLKTKFRLAEPQAKAVQAVTDALAETWAKETGQSADAWYASRIAGVEKGDLLPDFEELLQMHGRQRKGAARFVEDGKAIIYAFKRADVSTALHELGHVLRKHLPEGDLATFEKWAGVEGGAWEKVHEEKFARAWEKYLTTGRAPTEGLAGAFEKLKTWLTSIYNKIRGHKLEGIEIGEEQRKVFDRLLGGGNAAAQEVAQKGIQAGDTVKALTLPGEVKVIRAGEKALEVKDAQGVIHKVPRSSVTPVQGRDLSTRVSENATEIKRVNRAVDGGSDAPKPNSVQNITGNYNQPKAEGPAGHQFAREAAAYLENVDRIKAAIKRSPSRGGEVASDAKWLGDTDTVLREAFKQDKQKGELFGDWLRRVSGREDLKPKNVPFWEDHPGLGPRPATEAKVVNETDLLGQQRARVEGAGGKVEQGQMFDNEVSPELARERKLRDAHRAAGGQELFDEVELKDPRIESPAFRKWFGESKMVDEVGEPEAFYHGSTRAGFDAFEASKDSGKNLAGPGFYFSNDPEVAANHALRAGAEAPGTYKAFLKIDNPLDFDKAVTGEQMLGIIDAGQRLAPDADWMGLGHGNGQNIWKQVAERVGRQKANEILKEAGIDGIRYQDGKVVVAFEPTQIKSAIGNRGTFDPSDPNILYQEENLPETAFGRPAPTGKPKYQMPEGEREILKAQRDDVIARALDLEDEARQYEGKQAERLYAQADEFKKKARYFDDWMKTGQKPPWSPEASAAEKARVAERLRFVQQASAGAVKHGEVRKYLERHGFEVSQAGVESARLLPPDAAPEIKRAITDLGEGKKGGRLTPQMVEASEALDKEFKAIHAGEQGLTIPTPYLNDPKLEYRPRVPTGYGKGYFQRLKPAERGRIFVEMEKLREAKGIPRDEARLAPILEQRLKAAGKGQLGQREAVPAVLRGFAEDTLKKLDPETRAFIEKNGLVEEFLAGESAIQNTHGSQYQRLAGHQGLTISELNDVFTKHGAKEHVFSEDPAVQLFDRKAKSIRAKAADDYFKRIAQRLGTEIEDKPGSIAWHKPVPGADGIEFYGNGKGYGIESVNRLRGEGGLPHVTFPNLETAKAVQKSLAKLTDIEEVGPVLRWYDNATKVLKAYVYRPWPASRLRDRISNRLQSWTLGDVPVVGNHYTVAHRVAAGLDVKMKLPGGEVLDRGKLIDELRRNKVTGGGMYEVEFGRKMAEQGGSWNPLDPNNKFIQGGERLSGFLQNAPGQVLSGGGLGAATRMDARAGEAIDRIGHYVYQRRQGLSEAEAAKSVTRALFDYSNLNEFEEKVLNRAVFFYGYNRNVIPAMLDAMLSRPGKVAAMGRLATGPNGRRDGLPEHLPEYMREGMALPVGEDAEGNKEVAWGLGTPLEAAAEPFAGFGEGFSRGLEKGLANLNPLLRVPFEVASDRRMFFGRKISEMRKAPHFVEALPEEAQDALGVRRFEDSKGNTKYEMDPYFLYALESSPAGRAISQASKAADPRKSAGAKALNLLTGAKVTSVDEDEANYWATKDWLEEEAQRLERAGELKRKDLYYVPKARKGENAEAAAVAKGLRK